MVHIPHVDAAVLQILLSLLEGASEIKASGESSRFKV